MSIVYGNNIKNIQISQNEQQFVREWIQELVDSTPGFQWVGSLSINNVEPQHTIQSKKNNDIKLKPKWGFIFYHGQAVAILESIFQSTNGTAMERCFRWLAIANLPQVSIPSSNIVMSFYGPHFNKDEEGYTSASIQKNLHICAANHINLLVNPSLEQVENCITELLEQIQQQYLSIAAK